MTLISHSPNGSAVFCDDVRYEANGKQLFIGVYAGEMIISPGFPATLPTFSVVVRYQERRAESYVPVTIKIFIPGDDEPIFTATVPPEQFASIKFSEDYDYEGDPHVMVGFAATFPGITIKQAGKIKVRAYRGDDEIKLGALRVRSQDQLPTFTMPVHIVQAKNKEAAN